MHARTGTRTQDKAENKRERERERERERDTHTHTHKKGGGRHTNRRSLSFSRTDNRQDESINASTPCQLLPTHVRCADSIPME